MPELPDVEAFRQVLISCARGKRIERVHVYDTGVLHGVSARGLREALEGRIFDEPERHGKWLLARTDGPAVAIHFGMTGMLVCRDAGDELAAHDRVVLTLPRGQQLRHRDQRKLKGIWLAAGDESARTFADQGPDAATVSRGDFDAALSSRRGGLKSALTDQSVLAGLGNLLADEILWRARLHPSRTLSATDPGDRAELHTAMRRTLRSSIRAGRVPDRRDWLTGHRDAPDGTCPRCGTRLRHGRVAGRGTVWCPHCQDGSGREG
jgi:formamidopyrimidine-DNA glycosylase